VTVTAWPLLPQELGSLDLCVETAEFDRSWAVTIRNRRIRLTGGQAIVCRRLFLRDEWHLV